MTPAEEVSTTAVELNWHAWTEGAPSILDTTGAFGGVSLGFCKARNEMKAFSRGEIRAAGLTQLPRLMKAILMISVRLLARRHCHK